MIYIETAPKSEIDKNPKEVLRYLGYGNNEPIPSVKKQIDDVTNQVFSVLNCRGCFTICDIQHSGNTVDFGAFSVTSASLSKNLKRCHKAILFGATVGSDVDRLLAKYSKTSPASAAIAQAVGAVAIESFCDLLCARIEKKLEGKNLYLRPRFSPGYGDFSLTHQKDLFRLLECPKNIGVSLTERFMMTPTKSVSAVIGIGEDNINCVNSGCEICEKREICPYSRG